MQDVKSEGEDTAAAAQSGAPDTAVLQSVSSASNPPATIPRPLPPLVEAGARARTRRWRLFAGLFVVILGAAGGGLYWWKYHQVPLPAGIASGNGRVESDEIDITPKYAGRVAALLVDEGDLVKAGQIVARMDTRDAEATLQKSEAQARLAERYLEEAAATSAQQQTQQKLAQQEFDRTKALVQKGFSTIELLDQRQQALDGANAAVRAASARVSEAEQAIAATSHDVAYNKLVVAEGVLVAPRDSRVLYRLVNTGEVVGAGAKIFTLLDLSNIYMTVFLPTEEAGKIALGAEGRIVLDALPGVVVPGHVTFVSATSQFTPKMVETRSERDKLMFRVKVRVDPEVVAEHLASVHTGLPGVAYVRLDPKVAWPAQLRVNVPK
ncbi:MAG: HlyD family efflux transporter periplasmic adaptor subunit [Beijerinckiaceae bacterium]|nr:HlyD family efflux transporter periplasmic adaptor subunit [Beijerinckiaceae bacterium]